MANILQLIKPKLFSPRNYALAFWGDPSDTNNLAVSGGAASQMNDLSGLGNHATQATGLNKPTSGSSTIGSLNALGFDGVNSFMSFPAGLYNFPVGSTTMFIVAKPTSSVAVMRLLNAANGATTTYYFRLTVGNHEIRQGNTAQATAYTRDTNDHIFAMRRDGTNQQGFVDGVAGTLNTSAASGSSTNGFTLSGSPAGTERWMGSIGEICLIQQSLSNTDMNLFGNYLAAKWGCTWTNL